MMTVVMGIYVDVGAADAAVAQLEESGFAREEISVILESTPDHERLVLAETDDTPRGAMTGAIEGGVLGSLAFALLALPGVGVLAAGPLLAALGGGSAGAVVGGLLGAMTGHGISTHTAQEYETAIKSGHVVVAVHTVHARARAAKQVLLRSGGTSISDSVHFAQQRPAVE